MTDFSNGLSPAEAERLALLVEECGEVSQVVGKILRHGFDSCHPDSGRSNRGLLEKELGDLVSAVRLLTAARDVTASIIERFAEAKHQRVQRWLHHQTPEVGA